MIPLERLQLSSKTSWFKIPSKTRAIIIDEMDAKTRCIFAKCSKLCNEEAKKSKFYMYGLSIFDDHRDDDDEDRGFPCLKFMYDEFENGYWLKFLWANLEWNSLDHFRRSSCLNTSQTIVVCSCLKAGKETVIWTTLENGFYEEVRIRYLRHYLEIYKKQIQFFRFSCSKSYDFTLSHLENLKKIQIFKKPVGWKTLHDISFVDKPQMMNIDAIDLPEGLTFTSMNLFHFHGKNASVFIDDFDEDKCKEYLKMLKIGEIIVDSIVIVSKSLDFSNIEEDFEISNKIENEEGVISSFNFDSDDRKYSVSLDFNVLKIKKVFQKKMDQFVSWEKLPLHIQEIVIDKMDPLSRCRFAQCSIQSEKEAKRSTNYLYKIGVYYTECTEYTELQFAFYKNTAKDFWFEFMNYYEDANQTIVLCKYYKNCEEFTNWIKIESGKVKEVRLRYLMEYLSKYGKAVKYFWFYGDTILLREFNINNLRNLEEINIEDSTDENPDYLKLGYLDWQLIRRCKHVFLHNGPVLSFEQFLELDIESAKIRCDELEEGNNFQNYLNMLKNGKIHRNLKAIRFKSTREKKLNIHGIGPFLKIQEDRISQTFSFRSNFKQNQYIEVIQRFGDQEFHIKCLQLEESEF